MNPLPVLNDDLLKGGQSMLIDKVNADARLSQNPRPEQTEQEVGSSIYIIINESDGTDSWMWLPRVRRVLGRRDERCQLSRCHQADATT